MKKYLLSIAVSLLITMIPISANETPTSPIYVTTEQSNEADMFASANVYELVQGLNENTEDQLNTIQLGKGILIETPDKNVILNTYFYPVFLNEELKYMLRVVDNGKGVYEGFLSIGGVAEIKKLNESTSANDPATLYQSNGNLAFYTSNEDSILLRDPISDNNEPIAENVTSLKMKKASKDVQDISKPSNIDVFKPIDTKDISPRAYANLIIDYKETQGNNSWCSAYVSASAARYMTGNKDITASLIAKATGAGLDDAIEWDPLVRWWIAMGYNFQHWGGQVGPETVAVDLSNRKPVYTAYQWDNYKSAHALLIHGINGTTYKIWNPWYPYSESASATNFTYTSTGGITMTMYHFGRYSKR